ncbi:MAG: NAD-dependent epimerase/dehydratase family protein [Acidimicrobiia bacterium]|nr:NAD-dependent epimerase/dehydratase family protein [Acidimicrobiia bacterium]
MATKIAVTGAAGFVGSTLVTDLLADGHTVVGIDSLDDFYPVSLKRWNLSKFEDHPAFEFQQVDIRDTEALLTCTDSVDVMVHLAALAGVRPSSARPLDYYDVNVGGTASVLDFMLHHEVPHLVFASSSSIYGINPDVPWTEEHLPQPISNYANSKLAGERLVARAASLHGFTATAARLFTVYGPGQRPDLAITNFAAKMLNGEEIRVFGDGSALRDFTFVGDIVDGIRGCIDYTDSTFEAFNLARGIQVVLSDVIHLLEKVLDVDAKVVYEDGFRGDVPQTWGSIEKSAAKLGYRPSVDLKDGLMESRDWFGQVAALALDD